MGKILTLNQTTLIDISAISKKDYSSNFVIYCNNTFDRSKAVSMNRFLSAEIVAVSKNLRSLQMEKCLLKALKQCPLDPVVKDIDVLFNPEYRIDVIKLLIDANRKQHFSLCWDGTYLDEKLIYSDERLPDYKSFQISDYDILCIV